GHVLSTHRTHSLHDALPILAPLSSSSEASATSQSCRTSSLCPPDSGTGADGGFGVREKRGAAAGRNSSPERKSVCLARICGCSRSEEHTSELQSRFDLVCRL